MVKLGMRRSVGIRSSMCILAGAAASVGTPGHAQTISTQVFETNIPFTYNRGRNESVTERARPDFEPVGINLGSFTALPSIGLGAGYTDNVYQAATATNDSGFVTLAPRLRLQSNWSLNQLQLNATGNFVRMTSQPSRNEDGWSIGGQGRFDVGADNALNFGASTTRLYETPFSGNGVPIARSSLPIQSSLFRGLADFKFTRLRVAVAADHTIVDFKDAETFAGTTLVRDQFDRSITRGTAHVEYGVTPDAGVFLQSSYTDTSYRLDLAGGVANRDSHEFKILAGTSFDLSALVRGSFGLGYIKRNYRAALYNDISGLTVNGKIEYFPTELTTVTLALRREIEDSTIVGTSGYFNNGIALRVDHELLRYILLNLGVDYEHDKYRVLGSSVDLYRVAGGASYLMTNQIRLDTNIAYRKRGFSDLLGAAIDEIRGTVGITFSR